MTNKPIPEPYVFDIEQLPKVLGENARGSDAIEVDGETYRYLLVDQAAVSRVIGFVGMPKGNNLFASTGVPKELLPYFLTHEVRCNRMRAGEEGRCRSIEAEILETVSPELQTPFLLARRKMFDGLVALNKIDLESPADPLATEIAGTYKYLIAECLKRGLD